MAIDGEAHGFSSSFAARDLDGPLPGRDGSVPANLDTGRGSMATPRARSVPA